MRGIVYSGTGMIFSVRDCESNEYIECRIRGKLRLKGVRSTSPVVVGDVVEYTIDEINEAFITEVCQRRNYVIRRSPNLSKESHIIAANLDAAMVVVTLFSPTTNIEFIDRFLVSCEAYRIPAYIVLNKMDLAITEPDKLAEFRNTYELAGYEIIEISAKNNVGMERLQELLKDKVTLLSGNSGVGKSTIIRGVAPQYDVKTGEISTSHGKGKHTTTFSTMYELEGGGYVIDTPGIKGFGLLDIEPEEMGHYFPEIMKYAVDCQFYNCTHIHEPKCAVVEAVKRGEIAISRYESYLKIVEDDEKYRK